MRVTSFKHGDRPSFGVVVDGGIVDAGGLPESSLICVNYSGRAVSTGFAR